jgi:hypothetical protein
VRRSALVLLVAITLQSLAAVAVIAWWTRAEPAGEPAATSVGAPPTSVGAPRGAATAPRLAVAPALEEPGEAPEPSARPSGANRAGPSERSVVETPAPRRRALRSFRQEMKVGLAALRLRVAECGAPGVSLTLDVETFAGGVRVLEAHLDPGSPSNDPAVACARATLLGETFPAPNAEPGRRWQMPFLAGKAL